MNTVITSREAILDTCRQLVQEHGWSAVNIRNVAKACGVSVGSIYYYFDSKAALTAATVESIWCDIFHFPEPESDFDSFLGCVQWIFDRIRKGSEQYLGFFVSHSMNFKGVDQTNGQQLMAQSWEHMQTKLYEILMQDQKIRPEAFNDLLSPQKFVDMVFSLVISALIRQNYDDSAILEMIRRILY
ncbi:MAG: TetR/AcrR family transcriptional regulator [Lachnospiraceae bacterium]|nr:TetR/AcrR family transcriptional regulator [Lachnospiraceae bacterium]